MESRISEWYAVRCVLEWLKNEDVSYEERITLWQARSFDEAMELAQSEAYVYANEFEEISALNFTQAYHLPDPPGHGVEIFSLIRKSVLDPDPYLDHFFATGDEIEKEL